MGSAHLTAGVETPREGFDTAVEISKDIITKMVAKMKFCLVILVCALSSSSGSPSPLRLRRGRLYAPQDTSTRLFTGNSAIDAGAAGAALGAATQFFTNQVFNPCRGANRGVNTNTRFVNGETLQNGALGFLAGFAGSSLIINALGNPCGK